MPEWSGSQSDTAPEEPETWPTIFEVLKRLQHGVGTEEVLNQLEPPEREELTASVNRIVAELLSEGIIANPANVSSLPNPRLMVHTTTLGVLAGMIYTHAHNIAHNQHQEEEPDGSEDPAE